MITSEHAPFKFQDLTLLVCKRLRNIEQYSFAGQLYEDISYLEEAAKCFLKCNEFERAQ